MIRKAVTLTFPIRVVVYVVYNHQPVVEMLVAAGLHPPQISVLEQGHDDGWYRWEVTTIASCVQS